jgi:hypothetical protein
LAISGDFSLKFLRHRAVRRAVSFNHLLKFMALEKTEFNTFLTEYLWRDLIFRAVIWVAVTIATAYFVLRVDSVTVEAYFSGQTHNLTRVTNLLGTFALLLGVLALAFKDFEVACPNWFGPSTKLGYFGGIVRRLAGDLLIWTSGVLVSVLGVTFIAAASTHESSLRAWAIFGTLYLIMCVMAVVVAALSILVRRAEPPLAGKMKPGWMAILYLAAIVGFPIYLTLNHH